MKPPAELSKHWQPSRIVVFDWEFQTNELGLPAPCCVAAIAYSVEEGELSPSSFVCVGGDELARLESAPWDTSEEAVSVAFFGRGDIQCFDVLGWNRPKLFLDLFFELKRMTNGKPVAGGFGLLDWAHRLGIPCMGQLTKESLREAVIQGRYREREEEIKRYALDDVELTARIMAHPKVWPGIDWVRAIGHRGRYLMANAAVERRGIPIDVELLDHISGHFETHVVRTAKAAVNEAVGRPLFDGLGVFKVGEFAQFLQEEGLLDVWPKTEKTGLPELDKSFLKDWAELDPRFRVLHEARKILNQGSMGARLRVRPDGRARAWLNPLSTKTGRCAPAEGKRETGSTPTDRDPFVFAGSRWVRSLIKPEPGRGLAYIDFVSQEIWVAAAVSGDQNLLRCYQAPDPYVEFGIIGGLLPPAATKRTHEAERKRLKTVMLGLGYGMGAGLLAARMKSTRKEAERLIELHREVFSTFWQWQERVSLFARSEGYVFNPQGWSMAVTGWGGKRGRGVESNTIKNWVIQSTGAACLQTALAMVEEAGIETVATIHDAIMIEAPIGLIEEHTERARKLMGEAARLTVGFDEAPCRTDFEIVTYPDRFTDEDGADMFERIVGELPPMGLTIGKEGVTL